MSVVLTIYNSECRLDGLSIDRFKELKDLLSYALDPQASFYAGRGYNKKVSLLGKKGTFPSGLLYIVDQFLWKTAKVNHTIYDLRKRPEPQEGMFKLSLGLTPYPEQIEASRACVEHYRGTVSAVTGFGKSVTMALLINDLQVKTLVVVPNLELKRQLTESFLKYFGPTPNITIENIDSKALTKPGSYELLIIDESHHSAAKTYRKLNKTAWKDIYYRFFFTATPFRARDEEQLLLESIAGQVIYEVPYAKAVEKGYITPLEAYFVTIPKTSNKEYATYSKAYADLIVNNEIRNVTILKLLAKLHVNNLSSLCLIKEIRHGESLNSPVSLFFAHGENEDTPYLIRLFNEQKLKVLVGTYGVLGEGVDTRPCEYVIIATPVKSRNLLMQMCGRAFRRHSGKETCKVILLQDQDHKWFRSSFREQCKILKEEYGIVPVKLDLD